MKGGLRPATPTLRHWSNASRPSCTIRLNLPPHSLRGDTLDRGTLAKAAVMHVRLLRATVG